MIMTFDKGQLSLETKLLEEKGFSAENAENIALYKQAIEYAAYFQDSIGYFQREEMTDEVYDKLDNLTGYLELACESMNELFMSEEEAKNDPSYYRKAYYN